MVDYHRSARVALIEKFLGGKPVLRLRSSDRAPSYETFSPEVLGTNVLFLYESH